MAIKAVKNTKKDWTGNSVAFSQTLGASNHSDRKRPKHDYYATEPKAVRLLLELEKFEGGMWECACGEGHLSKEMIKLGHRVKSTDLIDRGFGSKLDFLKVTEKTTLNIITNPPYKYANEFISKALDLVQVSKKVAFCYLFDFWRVKQGKAFLRSIHHTLFISARVEFSVR